MTMKITTKKRLSDLGERKAKPWCPFLSPSTHARVVHRLGLRAVPAVVAITGPEGSEGSGTAGDSDRCISKVCVINEGGFFDEK